MRRFIFCAVVLLSNVEAEVLLDNVKTIDGKKPGELKAMERGVKVAKAWAALRKAGPAVYGRLALFSVPILWGTGSPSLKYIYDFKDSPHACELSAIRCFIAFATLVIPALQALKGEKMGRVSRKGGSICAGLEIGAWAFLGQALQAFGVEHTTASKAGFILTTINVLVPALAFLRGRRVTPITWAACAISLLGIAVMNGFGGGGMLKSQLNYGDASVIGAAMMYSLCTTRIADLAPGRDSTLLTCLKKGMMAVGSIAWDVGQHLIQHKGIFTSGLWHGKASVVGAAWAATLWSSLVPGTLATVLQMFGQGHVSAVEAQLVFATTPVFNTFWAVLALHEKVSAWVGCGGAILIAASLMPHLVPILLKRKKKSAVDLAKVASAASLGSTEDR